MRRAASLAAALALPLTADVRAPSPDRALEFLGGTRRQTIAPTCRKHLYTPVSASPVSGAAAPGWLHRGSPCATAVVPFPSQAPRDSESRRIQYRNQSAPYGT